MPRFAYSIVSLVVVLALGACNKTDSTFCALNPGAVGCPPVMMEIDAAIPPIPECVDNAGCTTAGLPVCDTAEEKCVQCIAPSQTAACQGTTPVCNSAHTCERCRVHADCTLSDVCLPSGACAAEVDVAYVDDRGTDNMSCSRAMSCTDPAKALLTPRPYVKFHGSVTGNIVIDRNVTLFADQGAEIKRRVKDEPVVTVSGESVVEINDLKIFDSDDAPGVSTSDTAELTLKRVTISGHQGNGISCAGKSLTISGSTITTNDLVGISCTAGRVTMSSSTVTANKQGGIALTAGTFDITNNFIVRNGTGTGPASSTVGGVSIAASGQATGSRFEFNTVVDNQTVGGSALAGGVLCDVMLLTAANNIVARNLVGGDAALANSNIFGQCTHVTSSILQAVTTLNFVVPDSDPRNYHIKVGSMAIGQATTASTVPVTVDFDGDARPQGTGNDQGADEFKAP